MRKLSADYIFPLDRDPIKNGVVVIDDAGYITDIQKEPGLHPKEITEVYEGFICPGFINAHCHLELSYYNKKIPKNSGLDSFITELEQLKKRAEQDAIIKAIEQADTIMKNNGIVAAGDISNTSDSFKSKEKSELFYHTFIEIYGSDPSKADEIFNSALVLEKKLNNNKRNKNVSLVPHSTYSVSTSLFEYIKKYSLKNNSILCIHHQENEDENLLFLNKTGNIVKRMQRFGVDISGFIPGGHRPLESIADYLPKENTIQLVHNTVSEEEDISFAMNYFNDIYFCLCPNANLYIENKLPDINLFRRLDAKITLGTDSAASNTTLSILDEMITIAEHYPLIPLNVILQWGIMNGANFLGLGDLLGSLTKGKKPGINLIKNVDVRSMQLTQDSCVSVLA